MKGIDYSYYYESEGVQFRRGVKKMRYAKYKETGISWLPEVPEGWEVKRVASFLKVINTKN